MVNSSPAIYRNVYRDHFNEGAGQGGRLSGFGCRIEDVAAMERESGEIS